MTHWSLVSEDIDLVFLDMIMPSMSGSETFDHLHAINADVRVILSSGYSYNRQAKAVMAKGCKGFIQKPFNLDLLSERLREVFDKDGCQKSDNS